MSKESISKIMRLINDPLFDEFHEMQGEYSFFNVVGRTFTETWHSAMLGWLLNPSSNHGLGDYGLRRFMMMMADNESIQAKRKYPITNLLIQADLKEAASCPNEESNKEVTITSLESEENKSGRIDIFIDGIYIEKAHVKIIVEMKINDKIKANQCEKYIKHIDLEESKEDDKYDVIIYPVFITPEWNLGGDPKTLFGSEQWIVLDFQNIYDDLIFPCLANNKLSDFGRNMLQEYVKVLRYPNPKKGKRYMVITDEERELARKLQDKYGNSIMKLLEILHPEEDIAPLSDKGNRISKKPIIIKIDNRDFNASSIPDLYKQVLEYLVKNKRLDNLELPFSTSRKRYLIAKEPIHPQNNQPFLQEVSADGFYMEANKSRERGLYDLSRLLDRLAINYNIVDDGKK